MKVLVTGHRGYVGSVMVPMLLEEGYDVVGLDIDLYRRSTFGAESQLVDVPQIEKDLRDIEARDLEGIDAVFHLAALSNDPLGDLNEELTYDINWRASVKLAEAAKAAGVSRFVFASSCSNYGASGTADFLTEDGELNPITAYGKSKVRVEQSVKPMADDHFTPTFLRFATAYGYSPRLRFDIVVNNLMAWAYTTGKVMMKSDGTAWRPLIHVADMTRAFMAVSRAPKETVHGEVFNAGSTAENYTVRQVAALVKKTVPNSEATFGEGAGADPRNYRVDFGKINKQLPDFKPQWTVERGCAQLYEAYQRIGITLDDFEGIRYKRIAQIKQLSDEGLLDENLRWHEMEPAL
jgi:nucleoside-diphosphate-sugar epimerase